ncbi:PDF receptor-like [Schistocerca gregaria]|uniref:PDF receptor-like n=1 Tax=Schistocerca gregaria TaxID=7010 RepID=UPI00211E7868|nr:PDF receptor-like [Schistocerca gregaria]
MVVHSHMSYAAIVEHRCANECTLMGAYAPTNDADIKIKDEFYEELATLLGKIRPQKERDRYRGGLYLRVMFPGGLYCNWTWDLVLCWPPTRAGTTAEQRCPSFNGLDQTKFAVRRCSLEGRWEGRDPSSPQGWTNYTPCYLPETLQLMRRLYAGSEAAAKVKLEIAERTRTLEIVGFSVSLAALLLSLAIFCRFRGLRNNRTRIHRNLFVAMVVQVVIRLTLYADQAVVRGGAVADPGIDNTPVLCEASYVLLEYARTSMFMWMFVEGLYLHNAVTVTMFQEGSYLLVYSLLGWGVPVLMTAAWAVTTAIKYGGSNRCWWGYNLTPYFWILEGPRLGVIVLNFLFLLNIIRVLVVKLRQSRTSEIQQLRKAVRAAVVLLPLLGITNLVNMADAPLDRTAWEFALWSYATHFLVSFQGFFIACLYCFFNGEVRLAILKSLWVYLSLRQHQLATATPGRRMSVFSGVYVTAELRQPLPAACSPLGAAAAGPGPRRQGRRRKTGEQDAGDVEECEEEQSSVGGMRVSASPAGGDDSDVDAVEAAGSELEARDQRLSHGSVVPRLPPACCEVCSGY